MVLYSTRIKTALRNASLVIRMRRTLPDGIHLVGQATLQRGLYYILVWIWARNLADPQCVLLAASIRNRTVGQRGPRASEPSAGNEVWSTTLAAPLGAITTERQRWWQRRWQRRVVCSAAAAAETSIILAHFSIPDPRQAAYWWPPF